MFVTEDDTITISPNDSKTKWVALDLNNKIIAEGEDPNVVIDSAKKVTDNFTIMFVPIKGNTYIF